MPHESHGRPLGFLGIGLALAALSLAASLGTQDQGSQKSQLPNPAVTTLYPSGVVELSAPPPVAVAAGVECDVNGNIYLQYSSSVRFLYESVREQRPANLPLRKLSPDSKETVVFSVGPFQGYQWFSTTAFYVTPNGDVYNLAQACRSQGNPRDNACAWIVTKYKKDGSPDDVIKLRLPEGVSLATARFAAFGDGRLLLSGYTLHEDGSEEPFTGIFDRSGVLLANLTLPGEVGPAPAPPHPKEKSAEGSSPTASDNKEKQPGILLAEAVGGSQIVGAPDGTLYLLRGGSPERLYVISSDGAILREQKILPPRPGVLPFSVSVTAQDQLFIIYSHVPTAKDPSGALVLALMDPQSGKAVSVYDAPPKAGAPACMARDGEILFTRESKSGALEIVRYTPE
jgi:hypothetical protein